MNLRTNVDLNKNQLLNAVLQQLAGNHGSPVEGILWYDTTAKVVKFYDGNLVRALSITGSGGNADTLDGEDSTFFLARANHTGTQMASTISNFEAAVLAYRLDQFADPAAALDLANQKITNLANGTLSGDAATYGQLTSALGDKASTTYVDNKITALTSGAPALLDTLDELAAALGDDANFATNVQTQISQRARSFSQLIGNGSATSGTVTHNLNTRNLIGSAASAASPNDVQIIRLEWTTVNVATWRASPAPAANELNLTIMGV